MNLKEMYAVAVHLSNELDEMKNGKFAEELNEMKNGPFFEATEEQLDEFVEHCNSFATAYNTLYDKLMAAEYFNQEPQLHNLERFDMDADRFTR